MLHVLYFKVLVMRDYKILNLILNAALKDLQEVQRTCVRSTIKECNGFLCQKDDTCRNDGEDVIMSDQRYYNIIASATHIYLCTGNTDQLAKLYLPIIDKVPGWACCFDRKHVSLHLIPTCLLSAIEQRINYFQLGFVDKGVWFVIAGVESKKTTVVPSNGGVG